ncbi:retrovirus-related Pol polyprotein from transposon 297 [Trichonephila clavipes]|nr:retrovirus-related Pol polyprotein from transposon 297 [Trichonephila clavipes]
MKHDTVHVIETKGQPVHAKARRLRPEVYEQTKKEFEYMMEQGICRPSKSSWSSPLHVVNKKPNGIRPVGDYRALNAATIIHAYPIPHTQDFGQLLFNKTFFSKLDIARVYHHIPIHEDDIPKTAINTPFGLFEFPYFHFGLKNAAQTFQRFMHEILRGFDFCYTYLDDILIVSENESSHKQHVTKVLQKLNSYGLKLTASKCVFGVPEIEFLGHLITQNGTKPLPNKLQTIAAFKKSKQELANAAMLTQPKPNSSLILQVDASDYTIGGALNQNTAAGLEPLAFYSRKLNAAETKYTAYHRELLQHLLDTRPGH